MPLGSLARRARLAVKTVSAMGWKRTALRVRYELAHRSGWLERRYPPSDLQAWIPPASALERLRQRTRRQGLFAPVNAPQLRLEYPRLFPQIGPQLLATADRIVGGEVDYFSRAWGKFDPHGDWFRNPFTGQQVAANAHWTQVAWDAPESGDLKFQLEPARFGWVYPLVRAYWYAGDEKYAARFWDFIDGWCDQNPPQAGPLWICGQESALRLLGMVFGLYGFADSLHGTDERVAQLAGMIAAHADRILGTTVYARSQQNNHALSEAAGLLTAGLILPELPAAAAWRRAGRAIVEEQTPLQVYVDGAYTQHSHNYHRVMLNVLAWSVRVAEHHDARLSPLVYERLGKAAGFLRAMLNPATGQVSNYGPNDGALVLPLSACAYDDYRPAIQAAAVAATGEPILNPGVWNEEVLWTSGLGAVQQAQQSNESRDRFASASFDVGGYDVIRGPESWGMVRAARYHDRPNQADQLHLDVWWRGINLACDAGTYLYNGAPPWQNGLAGVSVHNTVSVDDQDQMTRSGRFLWLDWAQATRRLTASAGGELDLWRGGHDGYRRLDAALDHRRQVLRVASLGWLVIDTLGGAAAHRYRLHWMLAEFPHRWNATAGRLELDTPAGPYELRLGAFSAHPATSLVSGDPESTRGWRSRFYGEREPALSLAAEVEGTGAQFWTWLGPAGTAMQWESDRLLLTTANGCAEVGFSNDPVPFGIAKVQWAGATADSISVS